ncbi:MAG: HAD-IIIC family phosphatase [Desulfobacterota bacterium]|nr:HAD-IIIC family phosphatase [Thermodesulfobacteriota bacterium]
MKPIKLVIWDLDETFWKGTLSEGPVAYIQKNHDIVIELSRRGIINSIVSKNTFEDAQKVLEEQGIWDYFVFPRIAWQPKGKLIADLIEQIQLRPENVLFIDDNHLNRIEAEHYNPGIQTAGPEILDTLLDHEACRGKNDKALSRLKQYKVLEQKARDQQTHSGSNEDFLRSCDIKVRIGRDCAAHAERLVELINRTNQLNYTKKRLTREEFERLCEDPQIDKAYIQVSDRYGDYGICGFYARTDHRLEHFVFSCRILHMGVEHWVYHRLGCPALDITGEVATPIDTSLRPDWITEVSGNFLVQPDTRQKKGRSVNIILKGGCDLTGIKNYLMHGVQFTAEVDYVSAASYRINNSHSEILTRCTPETLQRYGEVIDALRFFDRTAFTTSFFSPSYDVYLYSVLDDYTRGLYRYRDTDFVVPFGDFSMDLTDENTWPYHSNRSAKHRLDRSFLAWFKGNFTFLGPIPPERFQKNIRWLCRRIPESKLLIVLNGSEVVYRRNPQNNRWEHHRMMNRILEETVAGMPHVVICDVRSFITSEVDHSHNIRHYTRQGYFRIACRINEILEQRFAVRPTVWERLRRKLSLSPRGQPLAVKVP